MNDPLRSLRSDFRAIRVLTLGTATFWAEYTECGKPFGDSDAAFVLWVTFGCYSSADVISSQKK